MKGRGCNVLKCILNPRSSQRKTEERLDRTSSVALGKEGNDPWTKVDGEGHCRLHHCFLKQKTPYTSITPLMVEQEAKP